MMPLEYKSYFAFFLYNSGKCEQLPWMSCEYRLSPNQTHWLLEQLSNTTTWLWITYVPLEGESHDVCAIC